MREKYNGILVINKGVGFTSHDVVAKLRGILKQRKMGHTGTLDPDATGVLPVALGNATKLNDMLIDQKKIYRTVMVLGITTDSQDMSGEVIKEEKTALSDKEGFVTISKDGIMEAAASFVGGYSQQPPMYSAVRVGGKRLYELARQGVEIDRAERWVDIASIDVEEIVETDEHIEVTMLVECSKGTYIRTLCNDIGDRLSCGACVKMLQRRLVGAFAIENAVTIEEVERSVKEGTFDESIIIPTDKCLEGYGEGHLKSEADRLLLSGNMIKEEDFVSLTGERGTKGILMYDSNGEFMATYKYSRRFKSYKPEKMFL